MNANGVRCLARVRRLCDRSAGTTTEAFFIFFALFALFAV
jgi:hypothetical protein